jgi:hypothetical protein
MGEAVLVRSTICHGDYWSTGIAPLLSVANSIAITSQYLEPILQHFPEYQLNTESVCIKSYAGTTEIRYSNVIRKMHSTVKPPKAEW